VAEEPQGNATRILCVDDSEAFGRALTRVLRQRGWNIDSCEDPVAALTLVQERRHELVLLDWKMPGVSGREACRLLRATVADVPIIVLTHEERVSEKLLAFEAGADDYVLKSVRVEELCARMKSVLRRSRRRDGILPHTIASPLYEGLEVDLMSYRVLLDGKVVHTTPMEARFLILLIQASRRLVSLEEIVAFVFQAPPANPANSVRVLATQLRRKIARSGLQLVARAAGYELLRSK
jgi:two-component system OmpR family response regulator